MLTQALAPMLVADAPGLLDQLGPYVLHPQLNVWLPREQRGRFDYSDGEVENRMLQQLRAVADMSYGSPELNKLIVDWPTRYHFMPSRPDLLRPLTHLLRGSAVLEVGAGCGAITRFLGETAQHVVAVEGSPRRAQIARERTRGLNNVAVVADDVMNLHAAPCFDVVTLIGVLEYSRKFVHHADPVGALLAHCRSLLKPHGVLIIAIENQLGLKYFAGAPEDHTGRIYDGVHDLYEQQNVVTFGRLELTQRLQGAGFGHSTWWYPFPDYKLPNVVLADISRHEDAELYSNILAGGNSEAQGIPYVHTLSEELTWPVLLRNGVAADFANSFLVVASTQHLPHVRPDDAPLAHIYSTIRQRASAKETTVVRNNSSYAVYRRWLNGNSLATQGLLTQVLRDEPWVGGTVYARSLARIVNRPDWTVHQVAEWARPWLHFLIDHRVGYAANKDFLLPAHFVDCTPFNIIVDSRGVFHPIDLEWHAREPISGAWVFLRGLVWTLVRQKSCAASAAPTRVADLVTGVCQELQWLHNPQERDAAFNQEARYLDVNLRWWAHNSNWERRAAAPLQERQNTVQVMTALLQRLNALEQRKLEQK